MKLALAKTLGADDYGMKSFTVEEADRILQTDPAIKEKLLDAELSMLRKFGKLNHSNNP